MATAISTPQEQEVIVTKEAAVVLTLTPDEAQTLLDVTGRIGGIADTSRRGLMDCIRLALLYSGVTESGKDDMDVNESIYFKEAN